MHKINRQDRERENIYLFHHNPRTYNNETYCIINSLDYDERATREDQGTYLASRHEEKLHYINPLLRARGTRLIGDLLRARRVGTKNSHSFLLPSPGQETFRVIES